ncbi:bifunctional metallophosphatase/5'-nucleotidase [Arcanobacterium canis]
MKLFARAAATTAACALIATPMTAFAADNETSAPTSSGNVVTLDLYTLTDVHGHIELVKKDDKKTGKSTVTEAGLEKMGCFLDDVRGKHPDSSFTLLGDNIGASPFTSGSLDDNPTIAGLNELKPVGSTIGNHELDMGQAVFKARVDGSQKEKFHQTTFPYLGANVEGLGSWTNVEGKTVPYLGEYAIWEAPESHVKVAFIGAIAEDVPFKLSPRTTEGMKFTDPIAKINTLATKLKEDKVADVVVAMLDDDVKNNFPKMGSNVDGIMGGDTHVPYEFDAVNSKEKLTSANPHLAGVASGSYTDNMGLLSISFDTKAKKVVSADAKLIPAAKVAECDSSTSASAPKIKAIVDKAVETSKKKGAEPIVTGVKGEFRRGVFTSAEGKTYPGSNRGIESSLGDLVADSLRDTVVTKNGKKADIGIINAGGLREDLVPKNGVITYADTFAVMPFSNAIGYVTITGADFVKALEQQWKTDLNSQNSRPMLKLGLSSNVSYTYDVTKPFGQRITSVTVNGKPIDLKKKYTVGSVTFLLAGGDTFDALTAGGDFEVTANLDRDEFNKYLKGLAAAKKPIIERAAKASIGLTLDRDHVKNGEKVKVTLRGLSFSEGPSVTKNVKVSAGGPAVSATVDNSLLDVNANSEKAVISTDGAGRATLEVPVSATCPATGGQVKVPLTVATDFATVVSPDAGVAVTVDCAATAAGKAGTGEAGAGKAGTGDGTGKSGKSGQGSAGTAGSNTKVTPHDGLSHTGANVASLAFGGLALVIVGAGAMAALRRR